MKGLISCSVVRSPADPTVVVAIFIMEGNAKFQLEVSKSVIFFYRSSWCLWIPSFDRTKKKTGPELFPKRFSKLPLGLSSGGRKPYSSHGQAPSDSCKETDGWHQLVLRLLRRKRREVPLGPGPQDRGTERSGPGGGLEPSEQILTRPSPSGGNFSHFF